MIVSGGLMFLTGAIINFTASGKIRKLEKLDIELTYNEGPGLMLVCKF
jgi:hypothetical protein